MLKPVIKWSGSKRSQSAIIKEYLPAQFNRYYEPFVGGGSMLYAINPSDAVCGDVCVPLIGLWNEINYMEQQDLENEELFFFECGCPIHILQSLQCTDTDILYVL